MQKQIIEELKQIRTALSKLVGTTDLPSEERFSESAIEQAAKAFKKLSIERGEWIADSDLNGIFRGAYYGAGAFIRSEFKFSNYFKKGRTYYYNKADIQRLAKELKVRNVNLHRYMELKQSQDNFRKKLAEAAKNKKATKIKSSYQIPQDLEDINTSETPKPDVELIKQHLEKLKEEFFNENLNQYIDIYRGNFAMIKHDYHFSRYREKSLIHKINKWRDNFNYANNALELITRKRSDFKPIKDEDMIQL